MSYYLNNLFSLLAIFAILGMSFNLLMGYGGLFSVAHGAFFGLGAYTTGVLMRDYGWSFLPALLASFLITGLVSVVLGVAARRVTDVYLVILTLAFQVGAVELYGNLTLTGGAGGLIGIPKADIFGYELGGPTQVIFLSWTVCLLSGLAIRHIVRSPFGRTLTALREDEVASRSLGKPTANIKIKTFVVSSALAGVAGSLFAIQVRYISPAEFALDRSIEVLSLAIIGGLATLAGPFIGSAVVVLIPEALGYLELPNTLVGAINGFVFSALVLLFLRFRPQGLVGRRAAARSEPRAQLRDVIPGPAQPIQASLRDDGSPANLPDLTSQRSPKPMSAQPSGARTLRCQGVSISFGGVTAVDDVTLSLRPGAITGLVGPNGAGKTTLFNLLSGLLTPDTGKVYLGSDDITGRSLDARARDGIVRSFQEMRLFNRMTAIENLMLALTPMPHERIVPLQRDWQAAERERQGHALDLLAYLGLAHLADTLAGDLSYAEQKLLMIGRLLGTRADCYLLDEPMSGLDGAGRERIMRLLQDTVARGATICLVEHSLEVIRSVCSWVAFLADGKLVTEGPMEVITTDRELAAMYFGTF